MRGEGGQCSRAGLRGMALLTPPRCRPCAWLGHRVLDALVESPGEGVSTGFRQETYTTILSLLMLTASLPLSFPKHLIANEFFPPSLFWWLPLCSDGRQPHQATIASETRSHHQKQPQVFAPVALDPTVPPCRSALWVIICTTVAPIRIWCIIYRI